MQTKVFQGLQLAFYLFLYLGFQKALYSFEELNVGLLIRYHVACIRYFNEFFHLATHLVGQ